MSNEALNSHTWHRYILWHNVRLFLLHTDNFNEKRQHLQHWWTNLHWNVEEYTNHTCAAPKYPPAPFPRNLACYVVPPRKKNSPDLGHFVLWIRNFCWKKMCNLQAWPNLPPPPIPACLGQRSIPGRVQVKLCKYQPNRPPLWWFWKTWGGSDILRGGRDPRPPFRKR